MSTLSKITSERAERTVEQLRSSLSEFKKVCYANSLGAESVVLTDLIWSFTPNIEIFSIDTGRLYPETYDLIERLQSRYGRALRVYYPEASEVEGALHDTGFPSIGCAPCTRAVAPGDDKRSGRWWWERGEARECGLHPRHPRPIREAF